MIRMFWRFGRAPSEREAGDTARDQKDWVAAARHYQAHLARHPHDFAIWVQCGHANKEAGRYVQALKCYFTARGIRPNDGDNLLSIGRLYKRMNLPLLAAEFYRLSLAADGNVHASDELRQISTD